MLKNVRDLGNIECKYGRIKENVLIRGGNLNTLDENDILFFKDHKVTKIIDFRSEMEYIQKPDKQIDTIQNINLFINPKMKEKINSKDLTYSEKQMYSIYKSFILDEDVRYKYKLFLEEVAKLKENECIYFHCTAGKDRTGYATFLIYKILGVEDSIIINDYLKTNDNYNDQDVEEHYMILKNLNLFDPPLEKDQLMDFVYVKKEYLEIIYNAINEYYGSFDNFIKNGLKVSENTIQNIINICVEKD